MFVSYNNIYMKYNSVKYGISLDIRGYMRLILGMDIRYNVYRSYVGINIKGCTIDIPIKELYNSISNEKKIGYTILYTSIVSIVSYYMRTYIQGSKDIEDNDYNVSIQQSMYNDILKDRADANYMNERSIDGLMVHSAYYGDRDGINEHIRHVQHDETYDTDVSSFVDITTPVRFWVNRSSLRIPAGDKRYYRNSVHIDNPSILIVYQIGRGDVVYGVYSIHDDIYIHK